MNIPKPVPKPAPVPKKSFNWISIIIFLCLAAILVADYQGWLIPVQDKLDRPELTYNFGKYQFSLYVVLQSILVVVVIAWITAWLARMADRRIGRLKNIHPSSRTLIQKIAVITLYILGGLMTINVLGVDMSSLSLIGGAVGIGLGFGLQKITSNFISGLILLMERSVKVGDLIEMQDGTLGFVRRNSARYTLIETTNKREIMIPNEQFIIDKVINWTLSNKNGRIDIPVGVSYKSNLEQVQNILLEAASMHPMTLSDPKPQCQLRNFGAYSVEFMLLVWISDVTVSRFNVQSEIMFDIWHRFQNAGIEIPFPQQELIIKSGSLNEHE